MNHTSTRAVTGILARFLFSAAGIASRRDRSRQSADFNCNTTNGRPVPEATFHAGGDPDWMAVADDAVWVTSSSLNLVTQLRANSNTVGLKINVQNPCSGLVAAFGSLWIPSCGAHALVRADLGGYAAAQSVCTPALCL